MGQRYKLQGGQQSFQNRRARVCYHKMFGDKEPAFNISYADKKAKNGSMLGRLAKASTHHVIARTLAKSREKFFLDTRMIFSQLQRSRNCQGK